MVNATGWDTGLCQDYDKGLGRWFADRLGSKQQLRELFMNKQTTRSALEQALEALGTCRIMAKDVDGNYTREVTPKIITAALTAGRAALAGVQGEAEQKATWQEILREICETEPADFHNPYNICINPNDLGEILQKHTHPQASDPAQAAFDRLPMCGVKADGTCDQCAGSCMWFGKASEPAPSTAGERNWAEYPDKCPITRRPFFMVIEHPKLGMVPTYGGPYDSYTIPVMDGEADQPFHERELRCERYDHDVGDWVEDEDVPMRIIYEPVLEELQDAALLQSTALPAKCVCGETTLGVVHRTDGPCYYPTEPHIAVAALPVGELTDEQVNECWDGLMPSGHGKSRYDIARLLIAAAKAQPGRKPLTPEQRVDIADACRKLGFEDDYLGDIGKVIDLTEAAHGIGGQP